jgi:predicted DNA-binding transcriptional regulator
MHMALDFVKLFTKLGLTDTETRVYIAGLHLGPSSVQEIAKKARLSRTATYDAVAALQERGLMSTLERGKKRYFAVEDPDQAIAYFKEQVRKMNGQLEALEKATPELRLMAGGERPTVKFFEGTEAIYTLFNDVAKVEPKMICDVSNLKYVNQYIDSKILKDARRCLDPKKTKMRLLYTGTRVHPREGVEGVQAPDDVIDFQGEMWIYGDRVVFLHFIGKVVAVLVENQFFADTAQFLFELAWKCAKQLEEERDRKERY